MNNIPDLPHWLPGALVAAFILGGALLLLTGCAGYHWSAM